MFGDITRLKKGIEDESKKFKVKITKTNKTDPKIDIKTIE